MVFVQPWTVIKWHRKGFTYYWRRKSRAKPGRPPISMKLIMLIRRMSQENVLWGAPRIRDELALLGHEVAESTVAKYMVKHRNSEPSQGWKAFISIHMAESAACDFFVVPTLTFDLLFCFVVLSHDRRRILHVNVTANPSAAWTARQILEACSYASALKYLHRYRDSIFGWEFQRCVDSLGVEQIVSAPRSPCQNAFAGRVIETIRRGRADHLIALSEAHLRRVLREYVDYYSVARTHQSLDGNAPVARDVASVGNVVGSPVLGGLQHWYSRTAA